MKRCGRCQTNKALDQFCRDRGDKTGRYYACKSCTAVMGKPSRARRKQLGLCRICIQANIMPPCHSSNVCLYHWCDQAARGIKKQAKLWDILVSTEDTKQIALYLYNKAQDNIYCPYTQELLIPGVNMAVDHILPLKRFPELIATCSNLEFICSDCNFMKRAFSKQEFINRCQLIAKNTIKEQTVCLL